MHISNATTVDLVTYSFIPIHLHTPQLLKHPLPPRKTVSLRHERERIQTIHLEIGVILFVSLDSADFDS
jgi:hypothetical protein